MSLQAKLSRKVENARKRNAKKVLMLSPEKEQCLSCGRFVVAGPMGLSRHFSIHPECSMMNESQIGKHRPGSTIHSSAVHVPPLGKSTEYTRLVDDDDDDDDFGTSTFSDLDDDHQELLTDAVDATFNHKESQPPDVNGMSSSDNSVAPLNFSNVFGNARSKRDDDDGLNRSMFSLEEEVQVDLLQTLKRLRCPMIAYDEVMKWAVRSCSRGHSFHDIPISSRKTVMDKLRDRVDFEGLTPILKKLYLPYSNVFVDVVISVPMLSLNLSFHVLS